LGFSSTVVGICVSLLTGKRPRSVRFWDRGIRESGNRYPGCSMPGPDVLANLWARLSSLSDCGIYLTLSGVFSLGLGFWGLGVVVVVFPLDFSFVPGDFLARHSKKKVRGKRGAGVSGGVTVYMKLLCIHMHQINYTINVLTCKPVCKSLMQIYFSRSLQHLHVAILISFAGKKMIPLPFVISLPSRFISQRNLCWNCVKHAI